MPVQEPDSDPEEDASTVRATVRLRVERAAIPTLGELEGVRVVVETSDGRFLRLAVLVVLALGLTYLGLLPLP